MQRTRTAVQSVNALIRPVVPPVNILTPLTRLRVSTLFEQGTLQPNIHIQSVNPARTMSLNDSFHGLSLGRCFESYFHAYPVFRRTSMTTTTTTTWLRFSLQTQFGPTACSARALQIPCLSVFGDLGSKKCRAYQLSMGSLQGTAQDSDEVRNLMRRRLSAREPKLGKNDMKQPELLPPFGKL